MVGNMGKDCFVWLWRGNVGCCGGEPGCLVRTVLLIFVEIEGEEDGGR